MACQTQKRAELVRAMGLYKRNRHASAAGQISGGSVRGAIALRQSLVESPYSGHSLRSGGGAAGWARAEEQPSAASMWARRSTMDRIDQPSGHRLLRPGSSAPSRSHCRVQPLQLYACVGGGEVPIGFDVFLVAAGLPGGYLLASARPQLLAPRAGAREGDMRSDSVAGIRAATDRAAGQRW